ncbi:MAG: DUF2461 family protein [Acidimicrobiales bacterium]|nr:DUF2461 family protein [Acidimicrobiales bacterium]
MTQPTDEFEGFDPRALALLAQMPAWDKDQYQQHRPLLAQGVTAPGLALISTIAQSLDPELTVTARGSVSPLHTDLRFAKPGAPKYKDHLLLTCWHGADKRQAPILWLRIDAKRAGFASGVAFTPAVRDLWRHAIASNAGQQLDEHLRRLIDERGAEIAGDTLANVPKPYPADHPRGDLLRLKGFQVRFIEPLPTSVGDAEFARWCIERFEDLQPVHDWLHANLCGGAE